MFSACRDCCHELCKCDSGKCNVSHPHVPMNICCRMHKDSFMGIESAPPNTWVWYSDKTNALWIQWHPDTNITAEGVAIMGANDTLIRISSRTSLQSFVCEVDAGTAYADFKLWLFHNTMTNISLLLCCM